MKQTGWLNRALAACAAALALCGCQATPDAPIVVGKDNEAMIELALATPAPGAADTPEAGAPDAPEAGAAEDYAALCARYGCPERWQASFTEADGRLTVQADVAVDLPGTGDMPLARVHAERFEQALVSSLFAALCGETPMYFLPEERPRSAIEADIDSMQRRLRELDADSFPDAEMAQAVRGYLEADIKRLSEELAAAPEQTELTRSDGTLQTARTDYGGDTDAASGSYTRLSVSSNPYAQSARTFTVNNDAEYENTDVDVFTDEQGNTQVVAPQSGSTLVYCREARLGEQFLYNSVVLSDAAEQALSGGHMETRLATAPAEARAAAEALLGAAGVTDMAVERVELRAVGEYEFVSAQAQDLANAPQAYAVRFVRTFAGVPVDTMTGASESGDNGMSFGRSWRYENLEILVDDGGVLALSWVAPLAVDEVLTASAALLPFSEIETIFGRMMAIQYESVARADYIESLRFDVDRVALRLWRIIDKNSFTDGLLVPVWNFYCTSTTVNTDGTVEEFAYKAPVLTINAVDGSVIDPNQGY